MNRDTRTRPVADTLRDDGDGIRPNLIKSFRLRLAVVAGLTLVSCVMFWLGLAPEWVVSSGVAWWAAWNL